MFLEEDSLPMGLAWQWQTSAARRQASQYRSLLRDVDASLAFWPFLEPTQLRRLHFQLWRLYGVFVSCWERRSPGPCVCVFSLAAVGQPQNRRRGPWTLQADAADRSLLHFSRMVGSDGDDF